MNRPDLVTSALVLTAVLCGLALVGLALSPLPLIDLHAFLDAAGQWQAGRDPYALALSDPTAGANSGSGFIYPPYALVLFLGLRTLGPVGSALLWQGAQLIALACVLADLARPWTPRRLAAITILAVSFYPVVTNFVLGQVDLLMLAGMWAGFRLQTRRGGAPAGLAIGAAALLKLFPLWMTLGLLVRRRWLAAVAAVGLLAAAAMVTAPWVASLWPEYARQVLASRASQVTTFPDNQSIPGAVMRTLTANPQQPSLANLPGLAHLLGAALGVGLLLVTLYVAARWGDRLPALGWAIMLAALPLALTYSWQHYFVLAFPLFWLVASHACDRRDGWLLACAGIAYAGLTIDAAVIDHWSAPLHTWPPLLQALALNGSVIAASVLLLGGLRLARQAPQPAARPAIAA